MSGKANGAPAPRKLKILMLHGYTQSGSLFHGKTRSLEKILIKAFPPPPPPPHNKSLPASAFSGTPPISFPPFTLSHFSNTTQRIKEQENSHHSPGVTLIYPTAPILLHPADIPGFDPSTQESRDAYGWWKKSDTSDEYTGLEDGLATIRDAIKDAGGIDGVMGFSQGGCAAALVASLLEPDRPAAFAAHQAAHPDAHALAYPAGWAELQREFGQLKFAVSYSGFYAPGDRYKAFYEPKIRTKVLSVIGSLDSVVGEDRSRGLVERCVGGEGR
ncbi:Dihydrofolate reductase, partial [Lachnellula occidentalis]